MSPKENRIKKLTKEHRILDTEIRRLYNKTYSERTLKNLKQRKLKLKDEITKLKGESNG
tara:strand:+ start:1071 stop:1247 length:177 start_codon:yes stop_codon:yes gene_type:complete